MSHTPDQIALLAAIGQLLQPLARMALARGLPYQALDELLRSTLVVEARRLHADAPAHGLVSHVSTATGLSRREAARLLKADKAESTPRRWLAGEVFARWMSTPEYIDGDQPLPLPRQGSAPSFEALAQTVTHDVHPRTLLDELCRLGIATWDAAADSVMLQRNAFVPCADFTHMLGLLGDNVGDHLSAAVDNVLCGRGDTHFEQALYADELSQESLRALRPVIAAQWSDLFARLVPLLEQRIAADAADARPQNQRIRIGFYSYAEPMADSPAPIPPTSEGT